MNHETKSGTTHFHLDGKDQVRPCPFCGGTEVALLNTHTASYWIECEGCGVEVRGKASGGSSVSAHRKAAKSTLAAWNTRSGATHYAECPACFAEVVVECDDAMKGAGR